MVDIPRQAFPYLVRYGPIAVRQEYRAADSAPGRLHAETWMGLTVDLEISDAAVRAATDDRRSPAEPRLKREVAVL